MSFRIENGVNATTGTGLFLRLDGTNSMNPGAILHVDTIYSTANDTVRIPAGIWIDNDESVVWGNTGFVDAKASIHVNDEFWNFSGNADGSSGNGIKLALYGGTHTTGTTDGYVQIGSGTSAPSITLDPSSLWVQNLFLSTGLITGLDGLTITTVTVGRSISITAGPSDLISTNAGDISLIAQSSSDDVISGGQITIQAGGNINSGRDINLTPGSGGTVGNVVMSRGQLQIQSTSNQIKVGTGTNAHTTFTATASTSDKTVTFSNNTGTVSLLGIAETFSGAKTCTGGVTIQTNALTITDVNVVLSTSTGTKIGTATNQKLGFFNATPVVQQAAATDLGTALSNLGLRVSGSAYPITTSGVGTFQGGVTVKTVNLTLTDIDIVLSASTGTKLGTATTQKLGFWNATPIVQPASTGTTTAGFTANASANAVFAESTFTGNTGSTAYTISDIVKNLKNAGLLAA